MNFNLVCQSGHSECSMKHNFGAGRFYCKRCGNAVTDETLDRFLAPHGSALKAGRIKKVIVDGKELLKDEVDV